MRRGEEKEEDQIEGRSPVKPDSNGLDAQRHGESQNFVRNVHDEHFLDQVMMATGIECSYPTVEHGRRRDLLAETRHYKYWRTDFELCKEVGARYVRYGIPYYSVHLGPGHYDWSFCDEVLPVMREMQLIPIMDLCHFGVPDWVGNFQNPDWPDLFADFTEAFCQRYDWVRYYTPVNEIMVCSRLSAREGIWNEQLKSDRAMVNAHAIMCRATICAIERILRHVPNAVFFQSEAAEFVVEQWPETRADVEFENQLRFLTFDFLYGQPPRGDVLLFLQDNGLDRKQFEWFMQHGRDARLRCVLGMDYYAGNERVLKPDGTMQGIGPCLGWHSVARQYFNRYRKPIMLTETNNLKAGDGPAWLWKIWENVEQIREEGVPVLGYTWFSLQDQVDWDIRLREIRGKENFVGLVDLDRNPRDTFYAYRDLIQRYGNLPVVEDFAMGGILGPSVSRGDVQNPRGL